MTAIPINILLVEDEPSVREVFLLMLSEAGYLVRTAEDGFAALLHLRNHQPDVILSDLYMPRMSGFEFLSVVRRRFPAISVIAMSGSFQGDGIPPDVAADAFYEKGSGTVAALFHMMQALTHPSRPVPAAHTDDLAPVWIPRYRGETLEPALKIELPEIIVTCPECLRTFPVARLSALNDGAVAQTSCTYCLTRVRYATVQPQELPLAQRFPRKIAAGVPTALSIPGMP